MLLLKVTKVTTGHQKLPKVVQNSIISSFFARRAKKASAEGRSPPQELEVGPRSGPYLLVAVIRVAPGSSDVIAHGNGKNREVQKPLLITLHAHICLLLRT